MMERHERKMHSGREHGTCGWASSPSRHGHGDGLDPAAPRTIAITRTVRSATPFVIPTPSAGDRVESGFEVKGCSRTFESNVNWRLVARNGTELARGNTQGGGVDGPGPFAFTVTYTADQPQIGHWKCSRRTPRTGGVSPGGSFYR